MNRNRSILNLIRRYETASNEYAKDTMLSPLKYGAKSIQYQILSHCLDKKVPKFGFNERTIQSSVRELGHSSNMINIIGSSNPGQWVHSSPATVELIKFNLVDKRYKLINNVQSQNENKKAKQVSLSDMMLQRLKMDIDIQPQLKDMLSQLSIPGYNLFQIALPELFQLVDDMIFFSDEIDHHDMAWYAKRFAVASSYIGSKLFMCRDNSVNCKDTMEFAQEKLNRVMKLGEYYSNVEEYTWYLLLTTYQLGKSKLSRQ